jgi:hypothetical protein
MHINLRVVRALVSPVATVAVLITAVLAGCGSGSEGGSTKPADVVTRYHAAIAEGDGSAACAQLSAAAQKQLQESTQGAARGSCTQVIELLSAFYDGAAKKALKVAKVTVIEDGDAATASFSAPLGIGGPPQQQSYDLKRTGGKWKIEKLQLAVESSP